MKSIKTKPDRKEPPANMAAIAGIAKDKALEDRPAPRTLEVEPAGLDDTVAQVGEISPPNAEPLAGHTEAREVSFVPITPESEAETKKVEELFTKPGQSLAEKKVKTLDLGKALDNAKEAAPSGKSGDLMSIFSKAEDEENSAIKGLIASMPEVKMPEILNEAGAVKELIADLSQRDWVKAAKGDVVDAYTLRFISKGGKDDGKRPKKASH